MNTRKIMGAVGALVCAINFFTTTPVGAVASVEKQEAHAQKLSMPLSTSKEALALEPVLNVIEKRICDTNGLTVTSQQFQSDHDFETKLHPVQMVDYIGSFATGAGYIYVGVENVTKVYKAQNFRNQYDYLCMEKMLAHEITHNIEGHTLHQSSDNTELKAEKGAVRLTDALPEGGWGVYLVGLNRKLNRPEQNEQVMASFEKDSFGRIKIHRSDLLSYKGANGKLYPVVVEDDNGTWKEHPANAYFGGQVAYCIAKGAFRPENIQIAENNLRDIKFQGDYLLVCRSPKLPNGYRVLMGLNGDKATLDRILNNTIKPNISGSEFSLASMYPEFLAAIKPGYEYKHDNNVMSYWYMLLTCAIAQDNANR